MTILFSIEGILWVITHAQYIACDRMIASYIMEKENIDMIAGASARKNRHLSLPLKKHSRFADVSEETVESSACASIPKNSALNRKWAIRYLNDWLVDYNKSHPESPCPPEILSSSCPKDVLSKWLRVFVLETRNQRGKSIHQNFIKSTLWHSERNSCSEPQLAQFP